MDRIEEDWVVVLSKWEWDAIADALEKAGVNSFSGPLTELEDGVMVMPSKDLFSTADNALLLFSDAKKTCRAE